MARQITNPILRGELRGGWLGVPESYSLYDGLGMALGAYFVYAGATSKTPAWLTGGLGLLMLYIHSQRFFYAPQDKAGLRRLLDALNVRREDILSL